MKQAPAANILSSGGQVLPVIAIISAALAAFLILPMHVRRQPGREGPDETIDNAQGYDRLSRGLLFHIMRHMALSQLRKDPPAGVTVDAGCGPGYLAIIMSRKFTSASIIGLDISPLMIETAARNISACRANHRVALCQGDVQQLPFRDSSVDFIVSTGSMHHWSDAPQALNEMYRVLRPGGRLLIFDMRRDMLRMLYLGLWVFERFVVPSGVRQARGPTGSFWASFTHAEMKEILARSMFTRWEIESGAGWMFIHATRDRV